MLAAVATAVFWLVQGSAITVLRAIGLTLAFHRYFAHRAFQMTRGARFIWALAGTAAMQKGPLWWAGNHVDHHKYADREGDPHRPSMSGFYHAHIGWFLDDTRWKRVPATNPVVRDFGAAPELRFLDTYHWVPPLTLAAAMFAMGGWPWLAWGVCLPTVTLAHATFAINTVNHLWGTRRFATRDDSTNHPLTAFFAVGEGWHNHHHRDQRAARNGFYWWEIDVTYYVIRAMAAVGLAWNLQPEPARIYAEAAEGRPLVPAPVRSEK